MTQYFPRVMWVGPMLGKNPGWVTTQGEILADLFSKAGYESLTTSSIPARIPRLIDTVQTLLRRQREYDLIVLNVFSGPAFWMADISSRLAKQLHKPLIMVLRGGNLPEFSQSRKSWVTRVLSRAAQVVAPSGFMAEFARSQKLPVAIIPNVLDIAQYPFRLRDSAEPNLLWMRTYHSIYHPEMAVEVLQKVREVFPEARLTMGGQDKGLQASVEKLVQNLGLQAQVRVRGFMNLAAKQEEFNRHDIYLHTNRVDNAPVSVIEAAAFGLPVMATNVGGIPYLLENEKNALIVACSDSNAMAEAVIRCVKDQSLTRKLSENGRVLAEECAWENVRPAWEKVFSIVLQQ